MLKTQLEAPRIEIGKPLTLAGTKRTYSMGVNSDLSQQWQKFVPQIPKLPGKGGMVAYGVIFHANGADKFDYITAVEVADSARISGDFVKVAIPSQQYAVFSHPGHVSQIKTTMREIWENWLPASGYRSAGAAVSAIERYGEKFDPKTGTGDVEIWLPIKN